MAELCAGEAAELAALAVCASWLAQTAPWERGEPTRAEVDRLRGVVHVMAGTVLDGASMATERALNVR